MSNRKKADLPVIDLRSFIEGDRATRERVAGQAVHACETAGFLYVANHGIPRSVFDSARESALSFFHSPQEEKSRVHISKVPHHRGYVGHYDVYPDTEKGGDVREAYKVALELGTDDPDYQAGITLYGPNVWPDGIPGFRDSIYGLYERFIDLSRSIFCLFAVGLGEGDDYFEPLIQKPSSVMNVNYYPATVVEPGLEVSGIGAHTDYEAFAMLWQDGVAGLEIESLQGEWQRVEPIDDTLVINIGDLMARWTNDRFRATRHRVINTSGHERVSIACFGNTNYHAVIECIPSCCSDRNPQRYPAVVSGDYLMKAINRTYKYTLA